MSFIRNLIAKLSITTVKELLILIILSCTFLLTAQGEVPKRQCFAQKIGSESIVINGSFDEGSWSAVEWNSDFTVHFPNNGEKPKRQTQFKVLYDDDHVYFAFKCFHENIVIDFYWLPSNFGVCVDYVR